MSEFQDLLILLILAHLIGDFIFQKKEWVEQRQQKRWASSALYLHGFFHSTLNILVLWYAGAISYWYFGLIIGAVHIIIDPIKKPTYRSQILWFVGDQLVHLAVITASAYIIFTESAVQVISGFYIPWTIITAYLFLTKPASILISYLLPARPSDLEKETEIKGLDSDKKLKGISNAGEYIGILERLLTFTFIIQNAWIGIGFLITAKSVFRFSDIQQSKQREETEYIMIGTLLSFGIAIGCGLLFS
jgi:hypothetical protein